VTDLRIICLLMALCLALVIVGCAGDVPEHLPVDDYAEADEIYELDEPDEPEPPSVPELALEDEPEPVVYHQFVMPERVEHEHADAMLALLSDFSVQVGFPEFSSVAEIDHASLSVSTNLFDLTPQAVVEWHTIVRRDDMTEVGRRFFGEEFYFPKDIFAPEIEPFDEQSEYYVFPRGRGGWPPTDYLLLDVSEESENLEATFLPFRLNLSWDCSPEARAAGYICVRSVDIGVDGAFFRVWLEFPDDFCEERDINTFYDYLKFAQLPVPQDQLGTITVTFEILDDGSLIAVSSRYNIS